MPTIKQLPAATAVSASDLVPISQSGLTRSVAVSTLLSNTQPAISLAQNTLLGRVSAGTGGPEVVSVGTGLAVQSGTMVANGDDHVGLALSTSLLAGDEVVVNSNSTPKRLIATQLRSLFSAGSGVQIDNNGVISATAVSSSGATVVEGQTGPQGPAGQGFTFRGPWQSSTNYSVYDVVTNGGQTYVATTAFTSGASFDVTQWTLMAAQGAVGPTGAPGSVGATGAIGPAGPTVPATAAVIGAVKPGSGLSVATDGTLNIGNVTLPEISQGGATTGQLLGWTGTSWGPTTPSAGVTYTGAAPVSVATGVISLAQNGATAGQVLTWTGTTWAPQAPTVVGASLGSVTPLMDGAPSAGSSGNAARADHIHPSDTSRLATINNLADLSNVATARANLGLGGAATLSVGTNAGTVAAGNDVRLSGALQASAIPAASGQLLAGSGTPGLANAVSLGSGLTLSNGLLSSTGAYALPVASATVVGGVKQGSGVSIASDGTLSATGTSGVGTFNARTGAVTLTLSDVSAVLGSGVTAKGNLGLATVAASGAYADLSGAPAASVASTSAPVMDGIANAGTAIAFARADHIHPSDTTRLAVSNNLSDLGSAAAARVNLGLGAAAALNVGTAAGTVAAGNDTRIVGALQAAAIPAASGQLLAGSGFAGTASAVTIGSGLTLSGGTLSSAGGTTTSISGVEIEGATIQATMAVPYQMAASDRVIDVNKTTGAATKILLPASPTLWVDYTVIDGKGDAGTNNITLAGAAGTTINGQPNFIMNANNDSISLRAVNATSWRIS